MNGNGEEEQPLVVRFGGPEGATPQVPIHLTVVGSTQIVTGVVRPDLRVSRMAAQWASALDLSIGAGVVAQLATGLGPEAELWGPGELITPEVDPSLDENVTDDMSGGFLVGQDFLHTVWMTVVGPHQLLAFTRPTSP
jgi:hypothetical protein